MRRIAFDLDETLGVPMIEADSIVGFHLRFGCIELLDRLRDHFVLCLWSVSSRQYVDKALSFGLADRFAETYSWDEMPRQWKDVRKIGADFLVDDSSHHREAAVQHGIQEHYIVVSAFGSPEDFVDPTAWLRQVERVVFGISTSH